MLLLINTNRMLPPIAPIGLDYIYHAAQQASLPVEILDLCLADHPAQTIAAWLQSRRPRLIGLTLRNVDDCFWPSGKSFLPDLAETIAAVRRHSDAPIVLGGVGFSIFPREIMEYLPVEFGIHGDGELSLVELYKQLTGARQYEKVPGLLWRQGGQLFRNPPYPPSGPAWTTHPISAAAASSASKPNAAALAAASIVPTPWPKAISPVCGLLRMSRTKWKICWPSRSTSCISATPNSISPVITPWRCAMN